MLVICEGWGCGREHARLMFIHVVIVHWGRVCVHVCVVRAERAERAETFELRTLWTRKFRSVGDNPPRRR